MEKCTYCGLVHGGKCHLISAVEYYPDGSIKRVEFFAPISFHAVQSPGFHLLPIGQNAALALPEPRE